MKRGSTSFFILFATAALGVVLLIQVNWIIRTAKIKEELFNEKVNLVLAKTTEALADNTADNEAPEVFSSTAEMHIIDSLLQYYTAAYDLRLEYTFELVPLPTEDGYSTRFVRNLYNGTDNYQTCITDMPTGKNNRELKLHFPGKQQYILAEMGLPFIASVVLIVLVLLLSWRTMRSLLRQKRIAEHTTDFLNNMTHELKTPLTNIALAGRMLSRDTTLSPEEKIQHYSGIILSENEKLRLQVEEVLSMSALERGEISLHSQRLDLHYLIHESVKQMQLRLDQAGAVVHLQLEAGRHEVTGDAVHLINTLNNLLDNALKYSREKPELIIRTANDGKHLILSVSDNGIGIEKEYLPRIFEKYFRVPTGDTQKARGFGLGLAYVKKIAELHGGSVTVKSEKDKGSCFTLGLPYAG